uniref:Uncharacterized protein n=1 Tax=Loxodonta africana TaxID=9785 RepID=G3TU44_LOXAF
EHSLPPSPVYGLQCKRDRRIYQNKRKVRMTSGLSQKGPPKLRL